ncbi:hypothetical protein ANRL3_02716 [Anaerolineae bacterium]|nr:hypothetical protein ANRL3_02716 [Anaerolineae bacterium]
MADTIQVRLTDQRCELGDGYARKYLTTPPRVAVLSCEGMCLRGEVARRAANLIAHELAPDRTVRVCHGGLLETSGGMRDLVERAEQILLLDGCSLACGTRLLKGAFPASKPTVAFTDQLFELDRPVFSVDEVTDVEIKTHARTVAEKVVAAKLDGKTIESVVAASPCSGR